MRIQGWLRALGSWNDTNPHYRFHVSAVKLSSNSASTIKSERNKRVSNNLVNLFPTLDRRCFLQATAMATVSALAPNYLFASNDNATSCSSVVDTYVRTDAFQGVVALGRQGKPLFWKSVGFTNFETKEPMAPDSLFGIASISKMLTAVSVLRLQEKGSLQLDQPIATHLPYFRKDVGSKVTLRHLLANNSGVPNLFPSVMKADPKAIEQRITTEEAVHRFCEGDLAFAPGERFDYSLSNWVLVLAIVEAVTKMPYAAAMRALTNEPLGLKATTTEPEVAVDSYSNTTPPSRRTQPRPPYTAAAGGYYSNASDLMLAAHLIFDTSFLSAASKKELTTIEVPSDHYALGGRVRQVAIGSQIVQAAWDTGNTSGYRSVLGHRLDGKATVVVLNNTSMSQKTLDEFSDALLAAFS